LRSSFLFIESEIRTKKRFANSKIELNEYCNKHAESELLKAITNDVVGLKKIIKYNVPYFSRGETNFEATVTAEFMNKVGGIERTNLNYKFSRDFTASGEPQIYCWAIK
jgi:hypothetical protein